MELNIEKEASNKEIYKFDPEEPKEKKEYRHKKINDDIQKRFKALSEYTGIKRFNLNADGLHKDALYNLLEKKGIISENEYLDIYYLCVDKAIRNLESQKEELKKENISRSISNKIITPGALRFQKGPSKIVRG